MTMQNDIPHAPDMAFSIRIFDVEHDPSGEIVIGRFSETFALAIGTWSIKDYERQWQDSLLALVSDAGADVVLMTWAHPPNAITTRRGWRMHRYGDVVRVQDTLYLPNSKGYAIDERGAVVDNSSMESMSSDGTPISEWTMPIEAVRIFLYGRAC